MEARDVENSLPMIWHNYEMMNDVSEWNNTIATTIENMGYRILYCNHTKSAFSTFQIIIPNYSEVTKVTVDTIETQVNFEKAKSLIYMGNYSEENINFILSSFDKMLFGEDETLADILDVPVDQRYCGLDAINVNLFIAMLNLAEKKYGIASCYMKKYLSYLEMNCDDFEIWDYYRRITEAVSLKANNFSEQDIITILSNFYGINSIEETLDDIKEEQLFNNLPMFYCQEINYERECCNKCTFKNNCFYEHIKSIFLCQMASRMQ